MSKRTNEQRIKLKAKGQKYDFCLNLSLLKQNPGSFCVILSTNITENIQREVTNLCSVCLSSISSFTCETYLSNALEFSLKVMNQYKCKHAITEQTMYT